MEMNMMPLALTMTAIGAITAMFLYYRKRMGLGGWEKKLEVIDRVPIDKKNGLLLVKMDDTELLLGVSGAGISRIMKKEVRKPRFEIVSEKIIPFPMQETQLRA